LIYRAVVDRFPVPVPLDAPSAAFFALAFVASALLTARRPAYGLCALVLATPVAFGHDFAGTTITLPKCVLLGVFAGLSTRAGCVRWLRTSTVAWLLAALALYVAATALTAVDAAARGPAIRETFKALEYAAIFVAAYLCYRLDPDDVALLGAAAVAAIAVSLSALAQEAIGAPSGLYIGAAIVPRIAGLLEGPNQLSGYCEIAVATLGAWALVRRNSLLDGALALIVCAGVLTFSRAGWAGLVVIALLLAVIGGARAWRALRPAMLGLGAGIAGSAWWAIYAHTPGVLRATLEPTLYAGGVGNRSELWRAAWKMWLAHPLLGVGAGNFEHALPAYGVFGVRTHANSWYLQSLAEGGIVLFGATLALIGVVIASVGGSLQRLRSGSPWRVAALGATLALALHQVVDYLVYYPKVGGAWWLLVGVAAASLASQAP
jgi:O-antigen ligase